MREDSDGTVWTDRLGRAHVEHSTFPHGRTPVFRVTGALETGWADANRRGSLAREALAHPNPRVQMDPDGDQALWTWVVREPDARSVALFLNPVFDHQQVSSVEFTRLPGSELWTICLRLPAALRASYRISVWNDDAPPPWRLPGDRRQITLALRDAGAPDGRSADSISGSDDTPWSVASGPSAPQELWRGDPIATGSPRVAELRLPGGDGWVYTPPGAPGATPLLILFDGQVWHGMGLPKLLDAAISLGRIAPLHVAMLASGDFEQRWAGLGVPGRQVDTVIDQLLPRVRAGWDIDPRGAATAVSGQSLGGIASLWTLALSGGQVGHAVAQSPSLWRFDIADALLAETGWVSILMQAGTYEPDMLDGVKALAADLRGSDPASRSVKVEPVHGGHDWAVWRAGLFAGLAAWQTPG